MENFLNYPNYLYYRAFQLIYPLFTIIKKNKIHKKKQKKFAMAGQ